MPFCHAHANTWKVNGRPDIDEFVRRFAEVAVTADEIIRLDRARPAAASGDPVRAAVPPRRSGPRKTLPAVVMAVVRVLAATGVVSLLDRTEDELADRDRAPGAAATPPCAALLIYARRKVVDLADGGGWEAEFDRDVWQLRRLGFPGNQQPRLHRDPAAVAARPGQAVAALAARDRARAGGRPPRTARPDPVRAVLRSASASPRSPTSTGSCWSATWPTCTPSWPAGSATATTSGSSTRSCTRSASTTGTTPCPPTALVFTEDYPARAERPPRALAEQVMAQVEHPDNLARFDQPGLPAGHPDPDPVPGCGSPTR